MLVYPDSFEEKTGFAQIRQRVKDLCTTPAGQELSALMNASADLAEITGLLRETHEFAQILNYHNDFPGLAPVDIRNALSKGRIPGTFIDVPEWLDIRRILQSVRQIELFFNKIPEDQFPVLRGRARQLKTFPVIQERLDQVFSKQGQVRDQASPGLKKIRQDISGLQASIGKRMETVMQRARNEGWIERDTQASIRDGRLVIPIQVTYKRKIAGLVHDESATGKTAFIEPIELVELNNELKELELAEKREIIRILIDLTSQLRPYFPEMEAWNRITGEFDLIRARALLSRRWNGIMPQLSGEPLVRWINARHPLLFLVYSQEGRKVVPQDIELIREHRIMLISGPNAGGKSVCLKSVGIIQYMVQAGFLIPADEGSVCGIFNQFMVDIGDEQSIENDLSTYSSHLHHMKQFLKKADSGTLFMIDEFGAGTEPQLGGAIAESILEELAASGAFGVITTHYSNLKHFASSAEGVVNAAMRFDAQRMIPLFELETGKPGSSFAFEIARNIGLPEQVLQRASDRIGKKHIQFDKHLRQISRDKRYWENKRQKIRETSRELENLLARYSETLAITEKERKKILAETRKEAEEILAGINRRIEQAIREIRESQADKTRSREVREELDKLKTGIKDELERKTAEGEAKIEQETTQLKKIRNRIIPEQESIQPGPESQVQPFAKGGKIKLRDRDLYGEILDSRENSLMIAMGQMITTIPADQAETVSEQEYMEKTGIKPGTGKFRGYDLEERRLNFSPNLDLRGMRADEALRKVTEFIDEAIMVGSYNLRILHGKGDGILRQLIREYLSGIDVVSRFQDEDIRFGGTGITLVTLAF